MLVDSWSRYPDKMSTPAIIIAATHVQPLLNESSSSNFSVRRISNLGSLVATSFSGEADINITFVVLLSMVAPHVAEKDFYCSKYRKRR